MQNMQEDFFKELRKIQDNSINIMLCRAEKYENINDILTDVTYDTIYSVMELIDGYKNRNLRYEIIERESNMSINASKDLHNLCETYLECTDV